MEKLLPPREAEARQSLNDRKHNIMAEKQGSARSTGAAARLAPFLRIVDLLEKEKQSLLDKIGATSPDNAATVKRIHEIDGKLMSIQDAFTEDLVKRIGAERESKR